MLHSASQTAAVRNRILEYGLNLAMIAGASLLVAACARIYIPLPGTPVPLTVQNFAVLLVGLALGPWRGFAALGLYLIEGASGLPVFSPTGPGGLAQLIGPTGGYLMAYPFVAALTGYIFARGKQSFARAALASTAGEILLFVCGLSWLYTLTHSLQQAIALGLYWFLFAEVLKVMFASGAVRTWSRMFSHE
ncbi:MAG TPA: biotin transporter BioY [Terriglobales bacterium]|jgi:biotin transport system substrate-specific component|nr:biotin transporter BioY [Terriglobales bacterium]